MPDLSSVLDFSVTLDLKNNRLVVTDTSNYPVGVGIGITGIISTQQPDQIPVLGNWNTPGVIYSVSPSGSVELRRRSDNLPQQGNYSVTYEVDHPSYAPTTITKQFNLAYLGVTPIITPLFDVFTPNLSIRDDANYNYGGFNNPTVSRAWTVQVGTLGQLGGTTQTLSLAYNANYYDAAYGISLVVDLTYVHSTYAWLSIIDRKTATLNTQANTPPSFTTLQGYFKTIKDNLDNAQTYDIEPLKEDYAYAGTVLAQIKHRICSSDFVGLYNQIQDFLNVYHNHVSVAYVNTNTPIAAYNFSDVQCATGTGPVTDGRISTQDINNWNAAYSALIPDDIEVVVGIDPSAPVAGTNTWDLAGFSGWRVRLYINRIKASAKASGSDFYYTKVKASTTLTLTGYKWQTGDLLQIERY